MFRRLLLNLLLCSAFISTLNASDIYTVILAGGGGTRLWPLSRPERPKQFLPLIAGKSLLEDTVDRLQGVEGNKHVWVVTTEALDPMVRENLGDKVEHVVAEPECRNTAPALLFTLLEIQKRSPDARVLFLPADQYIPDLAEFSNSLNTALSHVDGSDTLTLLGIQPTFPATGYGYIDFDPNLVQERAIVPVRAFCEKPALELAREYVASGHMLWNAGIFCGKVSVFLEEFKTHAPDVVEAMEKYEAGEWSYSQAPDISFDYAVLEKSSRVSVLPVSFEWSDVGNLSVYLSIREAHEADSQEASDVRKLMINASRNLVYSNKKLIALVHVHDLCVVDTDDVLVIIPCAEAEKIKLVVQELKKVSAAESNS